MKTNDYIRLNWVISVQVELRPSDKHALHTYSRLIHSHWFSLPILILSDVYHIQKLLKCYINKMFN